MTVSKLYASIGTQVEISMNELARDAAEPKLSRLLIDSYQLAAHFRPAQDKLERLLYFLPLLLPFQFALTTEENFDDDLPAPAFETSEQGARSRNSNLIE